MGEILGSRTRRFWALAHDTSIQPTRKRRQPRLLTKVTASGDEQCYNLSGEGQLLSSYEFGYRVSMSYPNTSAGTWPNVSVEPHHPTKEKPVGWSNHLMGQRRTGTLQAGTQQRFKEEEGDGQGTRGRAGLGSKYTRPRCTHYTY